MNCLDTNWNSKEYEVRGGELNSYLDSVRDWSCIPTINTQPLHSLADGCLVRYQGMVQDVLPDEFFCIKYNARHKTSGALETRCGRYKDLYHISETEEFVEDESGPLGTRHVQFCVPIPGVNSWTREIPKQFDVLLNNTSSSGVKRRLEEDNHMEVDDDKKKKAKTNVENESIPVVSYNLDKYFPLPEKGGVACIVKHYSEEEILINTRIEVVGFLSVDPALEASQESNAEDKALRPPPSLVPRIHAIRMRQLLHCNPLLPLTPVYEGLDFVEIRSDLHKVFTQVLFGDALAAEYLICNLLSTVYNRQEGLSIGAFTVNICNASIVPDYPKMLFKFLQNLLPASSYLPLTVDLLNASSFVPRKDYESSRILSGRLQLAADTHLMVDETVMSSGKLERFGVPNVDALVSLSSQQQLSYDFTYYKTEFPTNIPVLILSQGKSMIPVEAVVKILPAEGSISTIMETFEAAQFFMSGPRLEAVRKYISVLRLRDCDMNNTEFVGLELANLRQEYGQIRVEQIHSMLVLSRLLTVSDGRTVLVKSDWDKAAVMERERRARLPK